MSSLVECMGYPRPEQQGGLLVETLTMNLLTLSQCEPSSSLRCEFNFNL